MGATADQFWRCREAPSEVSWRSVAAAVLLTVGVFASAGVAMRSVRIGMFAPAVADPIVVRLSPPIAVPAPPPVRAREITRRVPPPKARTDDPLEKSQNPRTAPADAGDSPAAVPTLPPVTRATVADSGRVPSGRRVPLSIAPRGADLSTTPMRTDAIAPAGVTIGSRTANTAQFRDSVATARMPGIAGLARVRAPSGRELAELRESQAAATMMQRRSTSAGNSRDVHTAQGEGMGGAGAVGGGLSAGSAIALPLFSSGPSKARRRADAIVDGENQAILRRLQDRLLLRRDSLRADSLRLLAARGDTAHTP